MPSTAQLRSGIVTLNGYAAMDLEQLWSEVATAAEAREALLDVLPSLVEDYGLAVATLAADWYDEARAQAQVARRFSAVPAAIGAAGAEELARWGVGPLFSAEPDWAAARTLVAGGLQRRIANASRETITVSSVRDPSARGWQREGGGGCDFCAMLIGRGAVYTEATAAFESHDHCNCYAVPAFT